MSSSTDLNRFHNRVERKKVAWAIINRIPSCVGLEECASQRACMVVGMKHGPPWCKGGEAQSRSPFCYGCYQISKNQQHAPHIRLASYLVALPSRKSQQTQFSNWRYYNENWRCHHGHGVSQQGKSRSKWCRHVRDVPYIYCKRHRNQIFFSYYSNRLHRLHSDTDKFTCSVFHHGTAGQYYFMLQCCIRAGLHPNIVHHMVAPLLLQQRF